MNPLVKAFVLFIFIPFHLFGQQSKKADKKISAALKTHLTYLSQGVGSGQEDQKRVALYLIRQFEKQGLKPGGDKGSWYQHYAIDKGRQIMPASSFVVNGKALKLTEDFFPFPFSVNKALHASVAMALAEDGVPWFVELKEILDTSYTHAVISDTLVSIFTRANKSASKGASALVVYNGSSLPDLTFTPAVQTKLSVIPVIYLSNRAVKKYFRDQSESLDIRLKTDLKELKTSGQHLVSYIDNGADSTIVISTSMTSTESVAVLIELARLVKKQKKPTKNFLLVATEGPEANEYYAHNPAREFQNMRYVMNLDTVAAGDQSGGLNKVKEAFSLLGNH